MHRHKKKTQKFVENRSDFILFDRKVLTKFVYCANITLLRITLLIYIKATPHKDHNKFLHTSCLRIFRHTARILFDIRQYACRKFVHSAEKSGCAICAQSLCGIA